MYTVAKEMKFDAAHRLGPGYEGKCANIHGHTWKVRIGANRDGLDGQGMAMDFGRFSRIRTWIDDNLDHALLIFCGDEPLLKWAIQSEMKYFELAFKPTSELLAHFLYNKATELGLEPSWVEVYETPTSMARYEP